MTDFAQASRYSSPLLIDDPLLLWDPAVEWEEITVVFFDDGSQNVLDANFQNVRRVQRVELNIEAGCEDAVTCGFYRVLTEGGETKARRDANGDWLPVAQAVSVKKVHVVTCKNREEALERWPQVNE